MATTQELEKLLDKTKAALFLGSNSAFYGALMCQLNFKWDSSAVVAATDYESIMFNPDVFETLLPETRKFILLHELNHVSRLHALRRGERHHELFNMACDYVINNSLLADGYTFTGCEGLHSHRFINWSEEEVYDTLLAENTLVPKDYCTDFEREPTSKDKLRLLEIVTTATQQAKGYGSGLSSQTQTLLDTFLAPVINWQQALYRFFEDKIVPELNWKKPNRRYPDYYMPSNLNTGLDLGCITYFVDVSGSVSDVDVQRFNSELKYVKDAFIVDTITICQFDTTITSVTILTQDDPLEKVITIGRGGTDLECVHEYMEKYKPKSVIVFTDLECDEMPELSYKPNLLYVVTVNPDATVPYGDIIHI